jgi:hypothetical protein
VGDDIPVDNESLLVTDFVNLKIKSAQFFRCTHRGRVCVRVFIGVSAHMYMSICVCTVFLKKTMVSYYDALEYVIMCCFIIRPAQVAIHTKPVATLTTPPPLVGNVISTIREIDP